MTKLKAMKIRKWYVKYQSTDVTHRHIEVDLFQISFDVLEKEDKQVCPTLRMDCLVGEQI